MARTHANGMGPSSPTPRTATSAISEQLTIEIDRALRDYHVHSKDCRVCRNPVHTYEEGRDLCEIGGALAGNITKLLYKKAEHTPNGTFSVQYKRGWEAVDGLIKIISHYNQGYYSNEIVDKKRQPVAAPVADNEFANYRGSGYEEDLHRYELAAQRRKNYEHAPSSSRRQTHRLSATAHYDPRTSFLDTNTGRTQADVSPASSNRSVHFDSHVKVVHFDT